MKGRSPAEVEEIWRTYLTTGVIRGVHLPPGVTARDVARFLRRLPDSPRCKLCYVPFRGPGGWIARRLLDRAPSKLNPLVCNICDRFVMQNQGGAEVELTMLFGDVRGSTALAEKLGPGEFRRLINRYFLTVSDVLIHADALMDKLAGDGVAAFFAPGIAGQQYAARALEAARAMLRATGHEDAAGPWIPIGIGLHTGTAFVGAVGAERGRADITALGDTVNVAARLAAEAGPGEIVASTATLRAAGLAAEGGETRQLQLKGRSEPVEAVVLTARSPQGAAGGAA